jgi:arylsulfatase A-like enzyme
MREWLLTGLLTLCFLGLAVGATPSHYLTPHLLVLGALYFLLARTLHMGSVWVAGFGRWLSILPALGIAVVLLWHCRELTQVPDRPAHLVAFALALAIPMWWLLRWSAEGRRATRCLGMTAVFAFLLAGSVAVVYAQSSTLRWHLLRHNKILGTPIFLVMGERVGPIREALWREGEDRNKLDTPIVPQPGLDASLPGPPILFVLVDTLRADSLAVYGGDPSLMPRLNAFAEKSLVFSDVTSNATYTKASMASMFTGLLPEEHGAIGHVDRLRAELPTLAEALQQRGYETAAFVTNFSNVGVSAGFDRGYDSFYEINSESGRHYARAQRVNRQVDEWLREREATPRRPLFLYVHDLDPHSPYLAGWNGTKTNRDMRAAYDEELKYFDAEFADLLASAREYMGPDTVVIFTADHGEEFGEHGEHGHGHALYREVISIPLLVHQSGAEAGRADVKIEGRDIFDLTLSLSGSADFDVASWGTTRARDTRYAAQYITRDRVLHRPNLWETCLRSIEKDEHVMIWSAYGDTFELYDNRDDPGQLRNLASERPDLLALLRNSMDDHVSHWVPRVTVELDEDTRDQLRQLGYLE